MARIHLGLLHFFWAVAQSLQGFLGGLSMLRFAPFFAVTLLVATPGAQAQTETQKQAVIDLGRPCFRLDVTEEKKFDACSVIIRAKPRNKLVLSSAYAIRSSVYLKQNKVEFAIQDADAAIKIDPKFALARIYRGDAFLAIKDYNRAITDYTQAINSMANKKDVSTYMSRAIAYGAKGEFEKSLLDLKVVIREQPGYANAHSYSAYLYSKLKRYDESVASYTEALAYSPNDGGYLFRRGEAYYAKGDVKNALRDLGSAIKIVDDYSDALMVRGGIYYDLKSYDEAIQDYTHALKSDPDRAVAYVARGYAYEAKKDYDKAIDDYNTALRLSPGVVGAEEGRRRVLDAREQLEADKQTIAKAPAQSTTKDGTPAVALPPDKRVALVIGNSAYQAVSALPNPTKDAGLVGDALRQAGIDVTVAVDLDRAGMVKALKAFAEKADTADWAMIYYAGHGIEVGGINYLIPIDAQLHNERDVQDEAITLQRLLSATESARKLRMVVLDACRNNPFAQQMKMANASRAVSRGLARVEPENGTLVVYAAKEGTTADDGNGGNSPFAMSFAKRVAEPGIEVNMTFRLVRQDVMKATGNKQEPFTYGALPPEGLYFAGKH